LSGRNRGGLMCGTISGIFSGSFRRHSSRTLSWNACRILRWCKRRSLRWRKRWVKNWSFSGPISRIIATFRRIQLSNFGRPITVLISYYLCFRPCFCFIILVPCIIYSWRIAYVILTRLYQVYIGTIFALTSFPCYSLDVRITND